MMLPSLQNLQLSAIVCRESKLSSKYSSSCRSQNSSRLALYTLYARAVSTGSPYFYSMNEMITYYFVIKVTKPSGPYAITGYSFGSAITFELAKIKGANGDEVKFLASIDRPPFSKSELEATIDMNRAHHFFLPPSPRGTIHSIICDMRLFPPPAVLSRTFSLAPASRISELGMTPTRRDNWANLAFGIK
ncbi:hypothetical protein B7494_g2414 [Chlorociboria aeruginascens]|nr:hypothetical protein B7494_g2414 [Chlorociboria aeruginascens]